MLQPKADASAYKVGHQLTLKNGKVYETYQAANSTFKWRLVRREYKLKNLDELPTENANDYKEGHRLKRRGGYYTVMKSSSGQKKWYKVSNRKNRMIKKVTARDKNDHGYNERVKDEIAANILTKERLIKGRKKITKSEKKEVMKMIKDVVKEVKSDEKKKRVARKKVDTDVKKRRRKKSKVKTVVKERVKKNGDIVKTVKTTRVVKKSKKKASKA
jgi:hypothetical protein